ncbi:MAG: PEP-CTERM sorting domain-containing protein [Planctomycetales bacterium]|nr:PEP-CTERM sorting domain-containing protein [Planctomycetales bacterium]MCA9167331.1 PEP-CTERM sorting domain-containing protein [Planctomycetales bacterium]
MLFSLKRWCGAMALVLGVTLSGHAFAVDVTWDGGDGNWEDPKWNGGDTIDLYLFTMSGANGWGAQDGEAEVINIGSGSTVTYDANALDNDFRMKQGSSLFITGGAKWQQISTDDWSENRWTQLDMSRLVLDGGTFSRIGAVNDEGGGAAAFGSWRADDNFGDPDTELDYAEILIDITNGGRLENEGQLSFGLWGDTPVNGLNVIMTINDGSVDLTGGDYIPDDTYPFYGDLVLTNPFTPDNDIDQPTYVINFTGPGTFTVDNTGIVNAKVDEFGDWINTDPITYQDLWDEGILQANGKSGLDGEVFANYFTVSGQLGQDDYMLTSLIGGGLAGDFDNDGVLTGADIEALSAAARAGNNPAAYDVNNDGLVNSEDRKVWINDLKKTYIGDVNFDGVFDSGDFVAVFQVGEYEDATAGNSTYVEGDWNGDGDFDSGDFVEAFQAGGYDQAPKAAVAAVPEPGTLGMLTLGGLLMGMFRRRR